MKDKDIVILHKAIIQLPTYQAPDSVWTQVELALEKSDSYSFPDNSTVDAHIARVKANLQAVEYRQEVLWNQAINQLPKYSANKDVFDQIISSADKREQKR